jgi:hypothetical protein
LLLLWEEARCFFNCAEGNRFADGKSERVGETGEDGEPIIKFRQGRDNFPVFCVLRDRDWNCRENRGEKFLIAAAAFTRRAGFLKHVCVLRVRCHINTNCLVSGSRARSRLNVLNITHSTSQVLLLSTSLRAEADLVGSKVAHSPRRASSD